MARITQVHATYGRKWNLDDYESATVSLDAFADVEEGETPEAAAEQLFGYLKEQVATQSVPLLVKRDERRRLRVSEVLEGLPSSLRELAVSFIQSARNDVTHGEAQGEGPRVVANLSSATVRKENGEGR